MQQFGSTKAQSGRPMCGGPLFDDTTSNEKGEIGGIGPRSAIIVPALFPGISIKSAQDRFASF
jgi:hypothetical protein